MRHLAGIVCGSSCVRDRVGGDVAAAETGSAAAPKAIVELFTSQGCSSCVAADAFFAELAKRADVVALSLHVDYWDYLGWRDTLERPGEYRAAAELRRGARQPPVYTPQIVVNGSDDFVGSDRGAIDAAIARSALPVPVTMRHGDGTVEIEVGGAADAAPCGRRRSASCSSPRKPRCAIARGENAGSTIDYYNVVRAMRPIGMWDGEAVKITLPEDELMGDGVDACAIIVQEDLPNGPGAIIGAAWLGNW